MPRVEPNHLGGQESTIVLWEMSTDTAAGASTTDWVSAIANVVQALAITLGGGWALWQYKKSRKGQARLEIEPRTRIVPHGPDSNRMLLVSLRIRNVSEVLFRHNSSTVVLMDASRTAKDGTPLIVRFEDADPFLPAYGYEAKTPEDAKAGRPFWYDEEEPVTLEPGEVVDSAIAFPLAPGDQGLLALRILIQGFQGSAKRWWRLGRQERIFGEKRWYWGGFYFLAPDGTMTHSAPGSAPPLLGLSPEANDEGEEGSQGT